MKHQFILYYSIITKDHIAMHTISYEVKMNSWLTQSYLTLNRLVSMMPLNVRPHKLMIPTIAVI